MAVKLSNANQYRKWWVALIMGAVTVFQTYQATHGHGSWVMPAVDQLANWLGVGLVPNAAKPTPPTPG